MTTPVMREVSSILVCEMPQACGPGRQEMMRRYSTPQDAYVESEWLRLWWMKAFLPPGWFDRVKAMLDEIDRIFLDSQRLGFPYLPAMHKMFRDRITLRAFKWVDDVARNAHGERAEAAARLLLRNIPEDQWRTRSAS